MSTTIAESDAQRTALEQAMGAALAERAASEDELRQRATTAAQLATQLAAHLAGDRSDVAQKLLHDLRSLASADGPSAVPNDAARADVSEPDDGSGSIRAIGARVPPPPATPPRATIVLKQPAEQAGKYAVREWRIGVSDALEQQTFAITHIRVEGKLPLMWGAHSYVGRIVLPTGVKALLFSDANCKRPFKVASLVGTGDEVDFWDHDHRVMAFKFLPSFELGSSNL